MDNFCRVLTAFANAVSIASVILSTIRNDSISFIQMIYFVFL